MEPANILCQVAMWLVVPFEYHLCKISMKHFIWHDMIPWLEGLCVTIKTKSYWLKTTWWVTRVVNVSCPEHNIVRSAYIVHEGTLQICLQMWICQFEGWIWNISKEKGSDIFTRQQMFFLLVFRDYRRFL